MKKKKEKKTDAFHCSSLIHQTMQLTVMFLSLGKQCRPRSEEQSDQGLHCLPFRLHRLDSLLYGRAT